MLATAKEKRRRRSREGGGGRIKDYNRRVITVGSRLFLSLFTHRTCVCLTSVTRGLSFSLSSCLCRSSILIPTRVSLLIIRRFSLPLLFVYSASLRRQRLLCCNKLIRHLVATLPSSSYTHNFLFVPSTTACPSRCR